MLYLNLFMLSRCEGFISTFFPPSSDHYASLNSFVVFPTVIVPPLFFPDIFAGFALGLAGHIAYRRANFAAGSSLTSWLRL